jgi:hypothetical protein
MTAGFVNSLKGGQTSHMHEVPLMPLWVTLFLTIWAPVGPLVGIGIGHYLSRSQQRRQWLADNEVKEWRELLTTLTTSFIATVQTDDKIPKVPGEEIESLKRKLQARNLVNEVLTNRIFIAGEVRDRGLFTRWKTALGRFDQDHDPETFGTAFGELSALILMGARAHIRKV